MSESPIASIDELAWTATPLPRCEEHPGAAHVCLPFPAEADLNSLLDAIGPWYGQPLTLDSGGSHPLLAAFHEASELVIRMYAWPWNRRWIGCGITRTGSEDRLVLLLADRATPAAKALPEDLTWVERIVAVTGWNAGHRLPPHAVDWTAVEDRLGTALPDDYKQIAGNFGCGAFDAYLQLYVPDASPSLDLVRGAERLGKYAFGNRELWEPYSIYPARGGLLKWADTEQGHQVYWLTEGLDPNRWPILSVDDAYDEWQRFDGTTGEFLFRMLTEPLRPFLRAESQDVPWFMRYG